MPEYVLSLDPGLSSGAALLSYTAGTVPKLEQAWQFGGGAEGVADWWYSFDSDRLICEQGAAFLVEKFNARNTGAFSYKTSSLEPLRCEGVLVGLGFGGDVTWIQPAQQYIAGGKDKADKKKRQHRALKDLGFYRTGKDFGTPDADDFRSSCAHALSWLMRSGHRKTYELVSGWNERNSE